MPTTECRRKEASMKTLKKITDQIICHGTDATKFDEPPIVLTSRFPELHKLYVCGQLPPMSFSSVEKCYWQNDIDGVNNLIDRLANKGEKIPRIKISPDAWILRRYGVNASDRYMHSDAVEHGDVTFREVRKYDIFIGVDEEGDLVYAEL